MKILCLISRGRGHLDFGGMGFLRVMKALQAKGHDLLVFTSKNMADYLTTEGVPAKEVMNIDWLWLRHDEMDWKELPPQYYVGLKFIELQVKKEKPDLVLLDSLLSLAANMMCSLDLPFVSFGSAGGQWRKIEQSIEPGKSLHNTNGFKEHLLKQMSWKESSLSALCDSPYLNVVFLGREFYLQQGEKTSYVNLFSQAQFLKQKRMIFSLGNGTISFEKMKEAVIDLYYRFSNEMKFEMYGLEVDVEKLKAMIPHEILENIEVKYYVDFSEILPGASVMVYAGGISTTWYCLEYGIAPIVVSGNIHDQNFNAGRVRDLNIGWVWETGNKEYNLLEQKCTKHSFRFTDDLSSLVSKLETLQ